MGLSVPAEHMTTARASFFAIIVISVRIKLLETVFAEAAGRRLEDSPTYAKRNHQKNMYGGSQVLLKAQDSLQQLAATLPELRK